MKKLTKIVALILGASMTLSLAGCGEKKTSNDGIKTLIWLVPGASKEDMGIVLEKLNEIAVEKVGAKLDVQWIDDGAYQEKLNTYMATSKKYDIAFAGYNNPLDKAAEKGGILALDELLEKVPALKDSLPDYAWDLVKFDGKIYGIPNYQVLAGANCINVENGILNDIGGFDPHSYTKLDEIEPYLEAAKKYIEEKGLKGVYPFAPLRNSSMPLVFGYCDDYEKFDNILFKQNSDGKWEGTLMYETPEFKKGVDKLYDWYQKGYIRSDIVSLDSDTTSKYAVSLATYKPGIEVLYKNQDIDVTCQLIEKPTITGCGALTVIGKDCQDPELAIKMIELVNTDKEFYNLLTLGIEGVHYEKVDDNTFRYITTGNDNKYWVNGGWRFGNQFNEYVKEGDEPDVWEQTIAYNNSAKVSAFAGFSVDTTPIRTELTQMETVLKSYSFVGVGAANPADYYEEFLQKLEAAGAEKVVAEYEKQINEFYSAK